MVDRTRIPIRHDAGDTTTQSLTAAELNLIVGELLPGLLWSETNHLHSALEDLTSSYYYLASAANSLYNTPGAPRSLIEQSYYHMASINVLMDRLLPICVNKHRFINQVCNFTSVPLGLLFFLLLLCTNNE